MTKIDPKGEAKLYLPTEDVAPFFKQFVDYCDMMNLRTRKKYIPMFWIYSIVSLAIVINLFVIYDVFDAIIPILFGIFSGFVFFGMVMFYVSVQYKNRLLKNRADLLYVFFNVIQSDIHPESGLKLFLDYRHYDDVGMAFDSMGSQRHPWLSAKFKLIDGSFIDMQCESKVRSDEYQALTLSMVQTGQIEYNPLLYSNAKEALVFSKEYMASEEVLPDGAGPLGYQMAENLRSVFQSVNADKELTTKASSPKKPDTEDVIFPKWISYLALSDLENLCVLEKNAEFAKITYQPLGVGKPLLMALATQEVSGDSFLHLSLNMGQDSGNSHQKLLKANPALAYGYFALEKGVLKLTKSLLCETLDLEELDAVIHGLAMMGSELTVMKHLPRKSKAYKFERVAEWEKKILEDSLEGIPCELESKSKKFKVHLRLENGRRQVVHIRFDRQDIDGNQLISLMSFCGEDDPALYDVCLEENTTLSYGAIGLASLGDQDLFVVTDNQLAHTADSKELRIALQQVAEKADAFEAALSTKDRF